MRIYTKTGDQGETGLFNGQRVPKDSPYIEGYGNVDELNSVIGLSISKLQSDEISSILFQIQEDLFELGADLATPFDDTASKSKRLIHRMDNADTKKLENWIDQFDAKLPKLNAFILPGGSEASATLHVARTVCRRSERMIIRLWRDGKVNPHALIYLNRLSDLLFVLARYANHQSSVHDKQWNPKRKKI